MKQNSMPSILDREVTNFQEDAFGHQDYAEALRSLIESKSNTPPFSIGLLGGWGSGKSTIKSLYLDSLKKDGRRNKTIKPLTFNAWRYGGNSDIKRALLRQVYIELGGNDQTLKDSLYNQIKTTFMKARTKWDIWKEVYEKLIWNLIPVIVFFIVLLAGILISIKILGIEDEWVIALISFSLSSASTFATKFLGDKATFNVARYDRATRVELPKTSSEEYEELLLAQIQNFKQKSKTFERLLIFVDDLDRLSEEEMVTGMDAIRTFMEIPSDKLPDGFGIVFVVSCDENLVAEALQRRRRNGDTPATVTTKDQARRYLDRIFQYRLEIPPFPKQDMRSYATKKLLEACPEIEKELLTSDCNIQSVIDRMIHITVSNPRNALQLVNAFCQCWWLAKVREAKGVGSDCSGALRKGVITEHPVTLAIICAIRVNFPDFYSRLTQEPQLIKTFTDVFIDDSEEYDELPPKPKQLLKTYCDEDNNLKPGYDNLGTYLSSIRDIRLPYSLTPFLLLAQDAVTRQFGDKANKIKESLVSGDTRGVLSSFGRSRDDKQLSKNDIQMLSDLVEDLDGESDVWQDHAAYVVSQIANRIPEELSKGLLPRLCDRLCRSVKFRSRIGIETMNEIVDKFHSDHQRNLVDQVVEDIFTDNGFLLSLPSNQSPSLHEATEITRKATSMIFRLWRNTGINDDSKEIFLEWLTAREIKLGDQVENLPFIELEGWIQDFEEEILSEMGRDYSNLLIGEIENDRTEGINIDLALERCKKVFNSLWKAGEDDRPVLWEQLNRLVSVKNNKAITVAMEYTKDKYQQANLPRLSSFIGALALRINKDVVDETNWAIEDWEEAGNYLVTLAYYAANSLTESDWKGIQELTSNYVLNQDTDSMGHRLVELLVKCKITGATEIINDMIVHLFDDLPLNGVKWLSQKFSSFEESQQSAILKKLNAFISTTISDEEAGYYGSFYDNLSDESLKNDKMQSHCDSLFSTLPTRHSHFDEFIKPMFSVFIALAKRLPTNNTGTGIFTLFNNNAATPDRFGWLHKQFLGNWFEMPEFPYEQLFTSSLEIARNTPNGEYAGCILQSLKELYINEFNNADDAPQKLLDLAVSLWAYHRQESVDTFLVLDMVPKGKNIANLSSCLEIPDDKTCLEDLKTAYNHFLKVQDDSQSLEATQSILARPSMESHGSYDAALSLWMGLMGNQRMKSVSLDIFKHDSVNDDQCCRMLNQVLINNAKLDKEYILKALPVILGRELQKTHQLLFENTSKLETSFSKAEDKNELGKAILVSIGKTISSDDIAKLADWLHKLNVEGIVSDLKQYGLNADDCKILKAKFTSTKTRKKIQAYIDSLDKIEPE